MKILCIGNANFNLTGKLAGNYEGELNSKGQAHGQGQYTSEKGWIWTGTFRENKVNGLCKCKSESKSKIIFL